MGATAHKRWSTAEIAYLDEHRASSTAAEIATKLGRSYQSVNGRMYKEHARRRSADIRAEMGPRIPLELEVVPPVYVLRERAIRRSIPSSSVTQEIFADPIDGYSALDNKARTISVQDALEMCALHNGKRGEIVALAALYRISPKVVRSILDGSFFDRLIPAKIVPREVSFDD